MTLYLEPADEDALFRTGATGWRMDVATSAIVHHVLEEAHWQPLEELLGNGQPVPPFVSSHPVCRPSAQERETLTTTLQVMLASPILLPGLNAMGTPRIKGIEIQDGSFDDSWHHDGLTGKREKGHDGEFFLLCYFGEPSWQDAWGGHFEYGERDLQTGWASSDFEATGKVHRFAPTDRQVVLGWNGNPRLVHRAAPMKAQKRRVTLIAPVSFE